MSTSRAFPVTTRLASTALRGRGADMPKQAGELRSTLPNFPAKLGSVEKMDLTCRDLFDTTPECVLSAAIDQIVQPRTAESVTHKLRQKYAEVAQGKFDNFDFYADYKDAMATVLTNIGQSTKRTRILYASNVAPDGWELVKGVESIIFLAEVDEWSDSTALGVLHQKLCNAYPHTVGALILAPISPHNGFQAYSREFMLGAQELCDRYGIQLIIDERQVGLGRTGPAFAFSNYEDVQPDVLITTAPSASFLPVTVVCTTTKRFMQSTDTHPVALASAHAAIEYFMDNDLPGRTAHKSHILKKALQNLGKLSWVHGICGGVELKEPSFAAQTLNENHNMLMGQMRGGLHFKLPLLIPDSGLKRLANSLLAASASEEFQPWDASLPLA